MQVADRRERWVGLAVFMGAAIVALLSVKPYAASWNDGTRLATVDSLVDRSTLIIDDSIFIREAVQPSPFSPHDGVDWRLGARDKIFIHGHFYSDKSPVPAFGMAAVYQIYRWAGGPSAAERPDLFCWLMNFITSGFCYIIAVCGIDAVARRIGLDMGWRLGLTAFFALGTTALPYAQHVNNHIMLLAVVSLLFLLLLKGTQQGWTLGLMLGIGTLLGIGYTIDLAAGPLLVLCIGGLLLWERGARRWLLPAVLAGLPWFLFHHIVNYRTGGTLGPANAVAEYALWPGSTFNEHNITGRWNHASVCKAALYALDMLFGKKGFLGHDLILMLPVVMLWRLLRDEYPERRIVVAGTLWAAATWLLYAGASTNLSGACCSIRWFVPLLVPGFVALGIVLRDYPAARSDAKILGVGGILLGACMAYGGAWYMFIIPGYWIIYLGTLAAWGYYRLRHWPFDLKQQRRIQPTFRSALRI